MKIIKLINSLLNFIVFVFFIVSLSFSFYALYDVYAVYENTELSGEILKYKPTEREEDSFGSNFNLKDIQKINKDIVGWVRIDNTNIDYPILAGKDNTDYLKKDYKGDYSPSGSIFLDYRNDRKLTDDFSVIYGHNMAKGLMFSDIKKFKDTDYFGLNKTGKLYTDNGVYDLTIYSFDIINANRDISYKLNKYKNGHNQELIDNLLKNAINKRDIVVEENDKFLLLSTCYGVGTYDRSVILTRLRKSTDINIIRSDSDIKKIEKDNNILENNIRIGLAKKIIVLVIYTLITIIIYIHISSGNIIKKIRKSRQ